MSRVTHDAKRKKAARRAAAVPAVFTQLTLQLSKADLAEALWGLASLVGEDEEGPAVLATVKEVNNWRAARSARALSAAPFETLAARALFPETKEALLRLAAIIRVATEETS